MRCAKAYERGDPRGMVRNERNELIPAAPVSADPLAGTFDSIAARNYRAEIGGSNLQAGREKPSESADEAKRKYIFERMRSYREDDKIDLHLELRECWNAAIEWAKGKK